jgi:hypothetical protein
MSALIRPPAPECEADVQGSESRTLPASNDEVRVGERLVRSSYTWMFTIEHIRGHYGQLEVAIHRQVLALHQSHFHTLAHNLFKQPSNRFDS